MTIDSLMQPADRWPSAVAIVVAWAIFSFASAQAEELSGPKWHPWFEFGGYYNSDDASRGEVTVFAPITQGHTNLAFIDARGKFFEDNVEEGNFAIGYRQMSTTGFNFGAWIGGDVRNTEQDNTFWQLSGGFEALSRDFDARLNWYGPITGPQGALGSTSFTQVALVGNSIFMTGGDEVGLYGVDAEIGFRIPLEVLQLDPDLVELRVYAGGYYFDHEDALEEVAGGKARAELSFNDVVPGLPGSRLTAEYEFSRDDVRDTRHEVGARLRIPFGAPSEVRALSSLTGQERRMLVGLERDTDIITVQSQAEEVEDALTSVDFDRVAIVADGGSVTTTSAASGANSLLIVNGTVNGAQTLQANQTLQGGGSVIQVRGRNSGTVANFRAPGVAGRLAAPAINQDNIALAGSNTHVAGLQIVGGGTAGVGDGVDIGSDKTNVFLTNLAISDTGGDGVDADDDNTIGIVNVHVSNADENGFDFEDRNIVSIRGGSITNPGSDGVNMERSNTVSITGLTVTGAGDDAVQVISRNIVSIMNSTFSNNEFGVFAPGNNNIIAISNTIFSDIGQDAILDFGPDNAFSITGSTFRTIGNDVFHIHASTLFLSDTTVAGTVGGDVFEFDVAGAQVLAGSTGNVNATTNAPALCNATGSFTGTIGFIDGTVLQDNVLPCN